MKLELLTDLTGYQKEIESLRQEWISETLSCLDLDQGLLESLDQAGLFEYLIQSGVDIVYYPKFGGSEIFFEGELVGEWGGPELELKIDEYNKYYYKVSVEYWSISNEEEP